MCKLLSSIILFLLFFTQSCLAVDESIYVGSWKGTAGDDKILLKISYGRCAIQINNEKVIHSKTQAFTYSALSPYPFYCIKFTDEKEREHLIYTLLGSDQKIKKAFMTGFYEISWYIPGGDGRLGTNSRLLTLKMIE